LNVLIIPENHKRDQYILKPIIESMMASVGRPSAHVRVCQNPTLRGISQAMDSERIRSIIGQYRQVHLFLLCVDRDDNNGRRALLDALEDKCAPGLKAGATLLAEHAHQEIEVWALAGMQDLPSHWKWPDVRSARDPKEHYFEPYVRQRGLQLSPENGYTILGKEAATNYKSIRGRCEEVKNLETRIQQWLASRP